MADSMATGRMEPEDWLVEMIRADLKTGVPPAEGQPSDALDQWAVAAAAAHRGDGQHREVRVYRLTDLLAASDTAPRQSRRLQSDEPGQRWTVTQMFQESGTSSYYLVFECRQADLEQYRGCTITILHDLQPFSLGVVDEEGVAMELFDQPELVIDRKRTRVAIASN